MICEHCNEAASQKEIDALVVTVLSDAIKDLLAQHSDKVVAETIFWVKEDLKNKRKITL